MQPLLAKFFPAYFKEAGKEETNEKSASDKTNCKTVPSDARSSPAAEHLKAG